MFLSIVLIVILSATLIVSLTGLLLGFYGTIFASAPFVPVGKHTLDEIVSRLELAPGARLYDLGSGDGRVLFAALSKNQDMTAVGIEIAPLPRLLSKMRLMSKPFRSKIAIRNQDFFKADFSDATHVFVYLLPKTLDKLLPKLERELRPGTRLVSCDFGFSQKEPDVTIQLPGNHFLGKRVMVYTF